MKKEGVLQVSALGDRLRRARLDRKISLSAAGRCVGRSRQSVAGWEAGTALIGVAQLALLAELYGVTTDYLIYGREPNITEVLEQTRLALERAMRPT